MGITAVIPLLLTGGSGRLGRELLPLLTGAQAPNRAALDVTDQRSVRAYFAAHQPQLVVHAAGYTDVLGAEQQPAECWRVNVQGTRHIAQACFAQGATLVHISSDYVFWGDTDPARAARGGYLEHDPTGPTRNTYALSKLAAETEVTRITRALIVRTSFRARAWPYPTAFTDVRTSQAYVDEIAPELALAITHAPRLIAAGERVLHVVGAATTVFELAQRRKPDVQPASRTQAGVPLPCDIILNRNRWLAWRAQLTQPIT